MKKIVIADDHSVVRRGLRQIIEEAVTGIQITEADSFPDLLGAVARLSPDLVIMDISMPGGNAFDALATLLADNPKLPVLVLTVYSEDLYARRFFKDGAKGYITKDCVSNELATAVNRLLAGRKYISNALAEKLADHIGENPDKLPHENLSDRELEVMRLIGQGLSVTDVAEQLHLSVKTVSTYRVRVLQKLSLQSNAEIIRYAMHHNLA